MDIQEILKKLHEQMTDSQIGDAVAASQPTISRLRRGVHARTYHDRAEAIKRLAREKGLIE